MTVDFCYTFIDIYKIFRCKSLEILRFKQSSENNNFAFYV